eukprot:SAG25_NODE_11187_length_311_cov_0.957547_1_plen_86_part_01
MLVDAPAARGAIVPQHIKARHPLNLVAGRLSLIHAQRAAAVAVVEYACSRVRHRVRHPIRHPISQAAQVPRRNFATAWLSWVSVLA